MKYLNSKISELDLGHEMRFIMMVYDNPGISQDDLVTMSGQSKASIAKSLKKLEDKGFIKRKSTRKTDESTCLRQHMKVTNWFPKSDRFQRIGKRKSV